MPVAPRGLIETERPSQIRVTTGSGERFTIVSPGIRGDSLAAEAPDSPVIALADIRHVELRRFSGRRTLALLALLAAGYGLVGTALAAGWVGPGFQ